MTTDTDAALMGELLSGNYALDPTAPGWARAFVACAQGRFGDALSLAQRHLESSEDFEGRLRITAGSALRQLGRHGDAERIDRASARGTLAVHLLVGRAANHVGLGDLDAAQDLLDSAREEPIDDTQSATAEMEAKRIAIRASWVATEISLGRDDPVAALELSSNAYEMAQSQGWPRHVAKSLLFQGVALKEMGRIDEARSSLGAAKDGASPLGASPISEVAERIIATLSGR